MKRIGIIFGFLAVVSAINQEQFKLPQEKLVKFQKLGNECAQEYNVDAGLLPRVADGTLPRDEATNKYLYCVTLKGGLIEEDGHIVVDKIAGLIGEHRLVEALKESLKKCNEVTKEDAIATVVEMNHCITSTAPVRFVL